MERAEESSYDSRQNSRNPFEHHPHLCKDDVDLDRKPVGDLPLPKNPMVRILDEAKYLDFANLTSRIPGVAEEKQK